MTGKNYSLLLSALAAATLIGGCHKGDADSGDAAPPPRPTKPAAGLNKPVPGGKGPQVAGKPAPTANGTKPGKNDPFKPGPGKPAPKGPAHPGQPVPAKAVVAGAPGQLGAPARPGAPGQPATPGQPAPGTQIAAVPSKKGYDPFKVTWHVDPPPPYVFNEVQPLRLASAEVEVAPVGTMNVREVANRRVSGIMSGDGVFAIIEQNGDTEIVKPGSLTKDGYRVVSINADSIKLQRKDGNIIRTQIVPLSDAATGQQAQPSGGGGLFGRPGVPGSSGPVGSGGRPVPGAGGAERRKSGLIG